MNTFYQILRPMLKSQIFRHTLLATFLIIFSMQQAGACTVNANFSYSVTSTTVTFTNLTTGANKYDWTFGDGQISGAQSPVHNFSSPNIYWVILTAYDTAIGGCFDTTMYQVVVPGCSVSANFGYKINAGTVYFENRSTNIVGLSTLYEWDFGDGSAASTDKDPTHAYSGAGPYNVMLRVYDTGFSGCSDTVFRNFDTSDCHVVIDFTYVFIGPKRIKMTNTSVNANWFSIPFDSNNEYEYELPYPGTHAVWMTGRNTWCSPGKLDTAIKYVYVPGCYANAHFSFGNDTNSTFAGVIYDYSTYRSGATYMWHFGDGDSSSAQTPNHVYPGPGKYNLCLTIRDSICVSTFCDSIEFDSSGNMVGMRTPFGIQVIDAILSVKDKQLNDNSLKVYPNPGNGIFTVKQDIYPIREVKVFDLQGKKITHELADDAQVNMDLSGLRSGTYIFTVTDSRGITKFVRVVKL